MAVSSQVMDRRSSVPAVGSVLVTTDTGHALLDPIAALTDGIPGRYSLLLSALPPMQPYMPAATGPPKKKRRVASESTPNEAAGLALHDKLKPWLAEATAQVRNKWLRAGAESWLGSTIHVKATEAPGETLAAWTDATASLLNEVLEDGQLDALQLSEEEEKHPMANLFHRHVINKTREVRVLSTAAASWLVPAQSGFVMADMKDWSKILGVGGLHLPCDIKLALLDPPWPSASVRRSSLYQDIDIYDLFKIDLPAILSKLSDGPVLVGVWVTNHAKYRRFVSDKLFRDWKISAAVKWYWVKITNNAKGDPLSVGGLPVFPLEGNSPRRCYEGLILGFCNPLAKPVPELPDNRAFLSVPLEHSRKPLVIDLLRPYVPLEGRPGLGVLELFARFVPSGRRGEEPLPGDFWLSVGNEAIKFNEIGRSWEVATE